MDWPIIIAGCIGSGIGTILTRLWIRYIEKR